MVTIKELSGRIQEKIFDGAKIPHGISNPVIHKENDKYYIAYFVYTYDKKNIETGVYQRPIQWILADIKEGNIVYTYDCKNNDFSEQRFDKLYSLNDPIVKKPDDRYFEVMDRLFDTVRASIAFANSLDMASYKAYLNNLMAITPSEYRVFYRELSV